MTEWMLILWFTPAVVSLGLHAYQVLKIMYYAFKYDATMILGSNLSTSMILSLVPVANVFIIGRLVDTLLATDDDIEGEIEDG